MRAGKRSEELPLGCDPAVKNETWCPSFPRFFAEGWEEDSMFIAGSVKPLIPARPLPLAFTKDMGGQARRRHLRVPQSPLLRNA